MQSVCRRVLMCVYLCVLGGDLQQQSQWVVVEAFIQGEQRSVNAALVEVAAVLLEADGLDPADDALVGPHKNIWRDRNTNLIV